MKLVRVMQKSPNLIDKIVGKCPICFRGNTDALLITVHDFTPEDAPKSNNPKDLREERHRYHDECMIENIRTYPDYMILRGRHSPHTMGVYRIRYLYDCVGNPKNLNKSSLVH